MAKPLRIKDLPRPLQNIESTAVTRKILKDQDLALPGVGGPSGPEAYKQISIDGEHKEKVDAGKSLIRKLKQLSS